MAYQILKLFRSANEIRRAMDLLGLLDWLKKLDPEWRRSLTAVEKKAIKNQFGYKCRICGSKNNQELAHIKPREEGGINHPSNIVLLCSHKKEPLGCHELYDRGFLARKKLRELIKTPSLSLKCRKKMLHDYDVARENDSFSRPLPKGVDFPSDIEGAAYLWRRGDACKELRTKIKGSKRDKDLKSEFFNRLYLAELLRRSPSNLELEKAWKQILRCNELLKHVDLPYLSRFYYEYGYIIHLLGYPAKAIDAYRKSVEIAHNTCDEWTTNEDFIAEAQKMVVEMLSLQKWGSEAWSDLQPIDQRFRSMENKMQRVTKPAIRNRWTVSIYLHLANLHIKAKKVKTAKEFFSKAEKLRDSIDARTGWWATGHELSKTEFLISVLERSEFGHHNDKLKKCNRALHNMMSPRAKRPEGIKDVLFALGYLLNNEHEFEKARKIKSIADRTYDPFSGLFSSDFF